MVVLACSLCHRLEPKKTPRPGITAGMRRRIFLKWDRGYYKEIPHAREDSIGNKKALFQALIP